MWKTNLLKDLDTQLSQESSSEDLMKTTVKLSYCYPDDMGFWKRVMPFQNLEELKTLPQMQIYIKLNSLNNILVNLEIALRIFLAVPFNNCSSKRGFSVLARAKNVKVSTLVDSELIA
ncbi:hypothetical protein PR048_020903 [Dryococelus australis]|uniref:Uncharacterized protein n=1 Tax=Dryococelus australis TaxID=614101 RepID=A0ABQ9GWS8_9NEOP|nr:hypothetical protein PR048_020903 [Dryococelus australis]